MNASLLNEFNSLINQSQELCTSIYLPTYGGKTSQHHLIRFKNLLRQAEELLGANRRSPLVAMKLLKPALSLLNNQHFWQHQDLGLAVFLADDFFHYYRLPLEVEELVVVSDQFHLKPLLPLLLSRSLVNA